MERKEVIRELNKALDNLEVVVNTIWELQATLKEDIKFECQCDYTYTGCHSYECHRKNIRSYSAE